MRIIVLAGLAVGAIAVFAPEQGTGVMRTFSLSLHFICTAFGVELKQLYPTDIGLSHDYQT